MTYAFIFPKAILGFGYICIYILGGDCLIERVKRWLATCRGGSQKWCGQARTAKRRTGAKPARFFFFAFPLKINETINRKLTKSRSNIDDKSSKIVANSLLGGFGRSRPFPGCVGTRSDGPQTPKSRPEADLGLPRASQERPGGIPKRPRAAPKTFRRPPREPQSEFFARSS